MHVLFIIATLLTLAYAKRFFILVGPDGEPTYDPPSIIAQKGDIIVFRFVSDNYTVTQSSFVNPCKPLTTPLGGVDSGFVSVADDATTFPEWSLMVEDDTASLWFHCAQGRHCQRGMVFAINPTPERTYKMYKTIAMGISIPRIPGSPTPSVIAIGPAGEGATAGFLPDKPGRTLTAGSPSETEVEGDAAVAAAENGALLLLPVGGGVAFMVAVVTTLVAGFILL